jgi:hypothetical protein
MPLSFIWNITISDSEGDAFDWWINCSNGQSNFSTGDSNGSKQLSLSGLSYSTLYTVWANATDPLGNGTMNCSWFAFTTIAAG